MAGTIGKVAALEIEVEHLKLRVGTLEVDLNEAGFGKVRVDGKDFPVAEMTIALKAGEIPKVVAVFHPIKHDEGADTPTVVDGNKGV